MKQKSKQNNPEQKTRNATNSHDFEFGQEYDPVKQVKQKNVKKAQPTKSKVRSQ